MKNKLQQKLLNISNLDPCINLKNRASMMIDLLSFVNQRDLQSFLFSDEQELEIKNTDFKNIKDKLNSFKDADDFISYCFNQGFDLNKTTINQLTKNFSTAKAKAINEVFKKSVTTAKIFKKFLDSAYRIQKEENIYPLYIAASFINGNDVDSKPINAPLLLYEVTIEINLGTVTIVKLNENVTVNEKINFYIEYTYGIHVDNDDIQKPKNLELYKKAYEKIVDINFQKPFEKFIEHKNQHLNFNQAVVLALLEPLGGVIKKDVETIIKKNEEPFAIKNKIEDNREIIKDVDNYGYKYLEINHPLNLFQKYAIASSLKKDTLIYGPPGTGKSETIASLIANIIYNNKNVLMVSEKMDALEVLEKRLGALASISLFAFKPEHKDKFYDALKSLDKSLKNDLYDKYQQISEQLKILENKHNDLLNYFKKSTNVANELISQYQFNDFIDNIGVLNDLVISKNDHQWFNQLFKFWTNDKSIFKSYETINNIYNLIHQREDVVSTLEKYSFKTTKSEIKQFLNYFNEHQHESWILKNFVKSRKDYTKPPLIKSALKNDVAIIKLFDEIVESDIESIDFSKIKFILNKPHIIENETVYKQLIVYFLLLNGFENNKLQPGTSLQELITTLYKSRQNIAEINDVLITNQYLYLLKNKLTKNPKLIQEMNTIISYAFLKKRPNINTVIKKHYEILRTLFPIWILSPIQTCILNPCKKGIFDYGIFDEASQMFLERAFPLVYRSKISVVAGDDKQLQPTSFFLKNIEEDETQDNLESVNQGTSLFEQANISMWSKFYLKNHYRSVASELIAFSNKYVYDNQLEFDSKNIKLSNPIEVFNVKGVWKYQSNLVEVDKILEIIEKPELKDKSIIIITFNQQQAKVLENAIENQTQNSQGYEKLSNETLKIRALENVQGDEADVVILSVSFARDTSNKFRNFFGPLSQSGGINRLNFAITRAKEKMIVVKSITSDDIKTSDNINNQIFKYFLKYVDDANVESLTNHIDISYKMKLIDDIIKNISPKLEQDKYHIKINHVIGKHQLDIAVIEKYSKLVKLGLILDTIDNINLSLNDQVIAINEQQFITDLKYKTYRLTIFEWKLNTDKIIKNILKALN